MLSACTEAIAGLNGRSSALDAVIFSIGVLEKDACLNAGFGSNLTIDGQAECDASLMSDSGEFGSVGAVSGQPLHRASPKQLTRVSGVCNPIQLACAVLKHSLVPSLLGRVAPL
jgi:taspase (threonine aspartase 1)